jgi:hypothetical protein
MSVERSLEDILALSPRTRGNHPTAQSSSGFQPVFVRTGERYFARQSIVALGDRFPADQLCITIGSSTLATVPTQRKALKWLQIERASERCCRRHLWVVQL